MGRQASRMALRLLNVVEAYRAVYQPDRAVSEIRNIFEDDNGRVGASKTPECVGRSMGQGQVFGREYSNVRVPVLALMNVAPTTETLLSDTGYKPKSGEERAEIDRFIARSRIVFARRTDKVTQHVPDARMVYLGHVGHYVFITREARVLREIHTFIADLDRRKK